MKKFLVLIKIGKYKLFNQLLHGSEERKKWIGQIIGFCSIIIFLYLAANIAFNFASEKLGEAFAPLLIQLINVFMAIGIMMAIRDSMEKVMSSFYEDKDIYLLVSSPVSVYSVIGYKYVQLVFATLLSMVVWLITPWIAIGRAFHAPWKFYIVLIPTLTLLLMIINAKVLFILLIINRFFSSRRVMKIIKFIGIIIAALAGIGIAIFWMWGVRNRTQFIEMLTKINLPRSNWYPHVWAANILTSFLSLPDISLHPLKEMIRLIALFISVLAVVIWVGGKIYYRSWELSQEAEKILDNISKKRVTKSPKIIRRGIKSSIIFKDIRAFIKDKRQVLMISMFSAILLLTILQFLFKGDANKEDIGPIAIIIAMYSTIINIGFSWHGFKKEGDFWWLLQSSPIRPSTLYNAKLILSCLFTFLYAEFWVLISIIILRTPLHISLLQITFVGLLPTMIACVNTAIGSFGWIAEVGAAKYRKNPVAKILTLIIAIVFFISILIGSLLLIVFSWEGKLFEALSSNMRKFLSASIVLGFYITISFISYFIGKNNVKKLMLEENKP